MPEAPNADDIREQPAASAADNPEADAAPETGEDRLTFPEFAADGSRLRWYAIHAYSGQEASVKASLLAHAEQGGLRPLMGEILVPMEEVAEIKSGEKKISKRKCFPGYVLVQLPEHPERHADLYHMVKDTPGVTGFIGSRTAPVPLDDSEVKAILEEIRGERERPKPKVKFEPGERVKIVDGPFANFMGNIDSVDVDQGRLKVMVEIFERLTSVEVEFWQVEKI